MDKIYYHHPKPFTCKPYKGSRITIAACVIEDKMFFGISRCSKKDQFSKEKGRTLALEKAINSPIAVVNVCLNGDVKFGCVFYKYARNIYDILNGDNSIKSSGLIDISQASNFENKLLLNLLNFAKI